MNSSHRSHSSAGTKERSATKAVSDASTDDSRSDSIRGSGRGSNRGADSDSSYTSYFSEEDEAELQRRAKMKTSLATLSQERRLESERYGTRYAQADLSSPKTPGTPKAATFRRPELSSALIIGGKNEQESKPVVKLEAAAPTLSIAFEDYDTSTGVSSASGMTSKNQPRPAKARDDDYGHTFLISYPELRTLHTSCVFATESNIQPY